MPPSLYLGCTITDDLSEGLSQFNKSLEEARVDALTEIGALDTLLKDLSTVEAKATLTVGTVPLDNQIVWEAVTAGEDGNKIAVFYEYLGPLVAGGGFVARPESSTVVGITIHLILPVAANATIDATRPVSLCLPTWMSNPAVAALVTGTLTLPGTGLPAPSGMLYLVGGKSSPLPNSETHANGVSRVFGKQSYPSLLKSLAVPALETAADAIAFVEGLDSKSIFVGGKLFFVEGTNLTGINKLYQLTNKNLTVLKKLLASMAVLADLPYLVATENVSTTSYELICNLMQPLVTIVETYRAFDKNLQVTAGQWGVGVGLLNPYLFWSAAITTGVASSTKLQTLGIPPEYWADIFNGTTPTQSNTSQVKPPVSYTVEDPLLLTKLSLTDVELVELLEKNVDGIRVITTVKDLANKFSKLAAVRRDTLTNGLKNKVKAPLALVQAADLGKTFNDSNRLSELATRGKACARLSANSPKLPSAQLPDLPSANLPDASQKLEAAFGALSSGVSSALKVFDHVFDALKKVITAPLNKIQNLSSLAENLFNNSLAKCLLGAEAASGSIDFAAMGPGTGMGSGGLADGPTPSIGGLPLPKDMFAKFMSMLVAKLEQAINSAFAKVFAAISVPLCMAMQLLTALTSMASIDLGSLNPCKKNADLNGKCPPAGVQELINESSLLGPSLEGMSQLSGETLTSSSAEVSQKLMAMTGQLRSYTVTVKDTITRGIQTIVDEVSLSIETKLKFVDEIFAAIKELTGDGQNLKNTMEEASSSQNACTPPSVGLLSDTITRYIGM